MHENFQYQYIMLHTNFFCYPSVSLKLANSTDWSDEFSRLMLDNGNPHYSCYPCYRLSGVACHCEILNSDDVVFCFLFFWHSRVRYEMKDWSLTLTFPNFQVKSMTAGRHAMMQHSRIKIAVLMSQLRETTQGEPSSQYSHPSAHGRHSKTPSSPYWLSSPCRQYRWIRCRATEYSTRCGNGIKRSVRTTRVHFFPGELSDEKPEGKTFGLVRSVAHTHVYQSYPLCFVSFVFIYFYRQTTYFSVRSTKLREQCLFFAIVN